MVDIKKRVAVVDTYAEKLINSEYSLREARDVIIGVETSAYGRKLEQQEQKDGKTESQR